MAAFPERLKSLREERGLSYQKLGEALGVSGVSLGYYERSERVPDINTLKKMCEYFDVTSDYLLGLSDVRHAEADAIAPRLEQVYAALFDIRKLAQDAITTVKEA